MRSTREAMNKVIGRPWTRKLQMALAHHGSRGSKFVLIALHKFALDQVVQRAGLVDVRRDGRFLYYRPNFTHMNGLIGFLTENCCVLADKGCGPECAPAEAELPLTKRQRA